MAEFARKLDELIEKHESDKYKLIEAIVAAAEKAHYKIEDIDTVRPWGGFIRFGYKDGDTFISEFFPDIDPVEARLGNDKAELSPKILIVTPEQRLSWQVHERRAERWVFLNEGGYYKSLDAENPGELITAKRGDVIQFQAGECHRLVGAKNDITVVAEIWQHTDPQALSDESDIKRLQDDYRR